MPGPLKCHTCGTTAAPQVFRAYGLFCSKACETADEIKKEQSVIDLLQAGFTKHPSVQNLWVKNGIAVSQEQVHRNGIHEVVKRHSRAAGQHRA